MTMLFTGALFFGGALAEDLGRGIPPQCRTVYKNCAMKPSCAEKLTSIPETGVFLGVSCAEDEQCVALQMCTFVFTDLLDDKGVPMIHPVPGHCEDEWDGCFMNSHDPSLTETAECTYEVAAGMVEQRLPKCGDNPECKAIIGCWADHTDALTREVPTDCREEFKTCLFSSRIVGKGGKTCVDILNSVHTDGDFGEMKCPNKSVECKTLRKCMRDTDERRRFGFKRLKKLAEEHKLSKEIDDLKEQLEKKVEDEKEQLEEAREELKEKAEGVREHLEEGKNKLDELDAEEVKQDMRDLIEKAHERLEEIDADEHGEEAKELAEQAAEQLDKAKEKLEETDAEEVKSDAQALFDKILELESHIFGK